MTPDADAAIADIVEAWADLHGWPDGVDRVAVRLRLRSLRDQVAQPVADIDDDPVVCDGECMTSLQVAELVGVSRTMVNRVAPTMPGSHKAGRDWHHRPGPAWAWRRRKEGETMTTPAGDWIDSDPIDTGDIDDLDMAELSRSWWPSFEGDDIDPEANALAQRIIEGRNTTDGTD